MRTQLLAAVLFLFSAAVCAIPAESALAAKPSDFLSWAIDKGANCDMRWNLIAHTSVVKSRPSLSDGTGAALQWPSLSEGSQRSEGSQLSHEIISTRSFFHTVTNNSAFLPLTARKRSGAARGAMTLESPADAQLNVPYTVRRPLNTSMQQKNYFAPFGDISRPRLNSFGCAYRGAHMFDGAVARPAYRAARPRIL